MYKVGNSFPFIRRGFAIKKGSAKAKKSLKTIFLRRAYHTARTENEIFTVKKTSGFSKAFQDGETRVFPLFDAVIFSIEIYAYGNIRGKKARKKRRKKPCKAVA